MRQSDQTSPSSSYGLVVAISALTLLLVTQHPKTPVPSSAIETLRSTLASAHPASRLSAIETMRTVVQLATTDPNVVPTATAFLRELGPELAESTIRSAKKPDFDADELAEAQAAVRVFVLAYTLAAPDSKIAALSAIVPPLSVLLKPTARPGSNAATLHTVAFQVVMHFATASSAEFRAYIAAIEDPAERSALELAIRQSAELAARVAAAPQQTAAAAKPKSMKMDFSKYS
jgi:hypothetical protein